jgi:hypothetical protein
VQRVEAARPRALAGQVDAQEAEVAGGDGGRLRPARCRGVQDDGDSRQVRIQCWCQQPGCCKPLVDAG